MNTLYIIASTVFFLWIARNIFFWAALWQFKEYRFDRMRAHLIETKQGRDLLFSPLSLIKILGIFSFGFVVFNSELLLSYQIAVTILYFYLAVFVVQEVLSRIVKRPAFTVKLAIIIVVALGVSIGMYSLPIVDMFFWLLILDKLIPLIIALFVFILSFPTELVHDVIIEQAISRVKKQKKLLVIGVTGSYGKSSTKEFVSQILSKKFAVIKTKGTINTPIGIAQTILSGLHKDTQIFVVEMGAYNRGEIMQMCKMVFPRIGIITGINDQHLSLFGSIKNTMKAKYELIDALPHDGIAIFNGNNENVRLLYNQTEKKKIVYASNSNYIQDVHGMKKNAIIARNIAARKDAITFDVLLRKNTLHLTAPVLGSHNVENILPGIYIAKSLGMTEEQISQGVATLTPPPKTMVRFETKNGVTIIDDTFNANPQAVFAALQYMKVYRKKRILVFQPMIELGKNANNEHLTLAKAISPVCDYLILTNRNFYRNIAKGIREGKGKCVVMVTSQETSEFIEKISGSGDIIVFEGKEAGILLKKFIV